MNNPENKESMDMLLFDYLEGNLSEEKVIEFEKELASDLSLQEELGIWETSYIDCDYYDTTDIEATILSKTKPRYNITSYLNMLLIICISFISSIQPEVDVNSSAIPEPVHLNALANKEEKSTFIVEEKTTPTIVAKPLIQQKNIMPYEGIMSHRVDEKIAMIPLSRIEKLPLHLDEYLLTPSIPVDKIAYRTTTVKKKPTRKALKEIRKMKKKATEDRMANEFIKGNVPYVVPINTSNF